MNLLKNGQDLTLAFTDANGSFSFANLSAGSYLIEVFTVGSIVTSLYGPITLSNSQPEQNVIITLPTLADLGKSDATRHTAHE